MKITVMPKLITVPVPKQFVRGKVYYRISNPDLYYMYCDGDKLVPLDSGVTINGHSQQVDRWEEAHVELIVYK